MAWYEETGPTFLEIKDVVYKEMITKWKVVDTEENKKLINEAVDKNASKSNGSWRGYYMFDHKILIEKVKEIMKKDCVAERSKAPV